MRDMNYSTLSDTCRCCRSQEVEAWSGSSFWTLKQSLSFSTLFTVERNDPFHVKSLDTASMKLGADMRMVKVQMMEKREKATRHKRSTTAAANFHSLQMAWASSCSRKRLAIYCTSSRIRDTSGSCSSSKVRVCSKWMSPGDEPVGCLSLPPPPLPHNSTLGSVLGGNDGLCDPME